MIPPPDHKPVEPRSGLRMDARLDQTTRQKVDELTARFHRSRATVLCQIMEWGLSREQTEPVDQGASQGPVRHLYLSVAADLHERVQKTATVARLKVAPWLRHMVRQITIADFPPSWQEERTEERSHESRLYTERLMLRLDGSTQQKLEDLSAYFDTSMANVVRELVAQARIEDFPPSWHLKAAERRTPAPVYTPHITLDTRQHQGIWKDHFIMPRCPRE